MIVQSGQPKCSVIVPKNSSDQEKYALDELKYFVEKFTEARLPDRPDSEPLPAGNLILIGKLDSNIYIRNLYNKGLLYGQKDLAEEEFIIKSVDDGGRSFLVIAGGDDGGVVHGVHALAEKMIESITEISPVDLDFYMVSVPSIALKPVDLRDSPFYSVRCALSKEDPNWMSRHRINISGAEGVWSGTGIDDGLGTAFKYVDDRQFDDMQDESYTERSQRILNLQIRLKELSRRGIEPYLFMYVMGEPTKAMMESHPELLDDLVPYQYSRNGAWYKPISWTKPESRTMIRELVKSIVKEYSPWLKGFHLRSWGGETRAPAGNGTDQQELLWNIYYDIIDAAREVDPDFKLLISGYDQYWLVDPKRVHAAKLPGGTIFMKKWGLDGEPISDPGVAIDFINSLGLHGQRVLIFSHDTEEVMPLWMIETDMFVEGVRRYADNPYVIGLGGFTLQGEVGLAHLDKIVSTRLGWDPHENYIGLMQNYLASYYSSLVAEDILNALRINSKALSDYFSDYGGSVSITGDYGNGSYGFATRFWDIIGQKSVADTLSIPDLKTAEHAKERLSSLLPRQQGAANEMTSAGELIRPMTTLAEWNYLDGLHLMRMWVSFFESRLRLVEAVETGLRGGSTEQVTMKLSSAIEYSREMQMEIQEIRSFVQVFDYDDLTAKESLISSIDKEIEFLENFDPSEIIRTPGENGDHGETDLSIAGLMFHPNPTSGKAVFCYNLTSDADEVTITIYTILGRRVRKIVGASARSGYNEEIWEAKDDGGTKLASGTYLYKVLAERNGKKTQEIGKLSIVR